MDPLELINKVTFFSLFDKEKRSTLTKMLKVVHIKAGEMLFQLGDLGDKMYIVQTGLIELYTRDHSGAKISLAFCKTEDFFGELAMFDGGSRTATAIALEDSTLFVLTREKMISFLEQNPAAALDMIKVMGQRIRNTNDVLRRRVSKNVNEETEDRRTVSEKIADSIAQICGSIYFLLTHILLFLFWILWNIESIYSPGINLLKFPVFDPFPFGLLAMSVSVEAIILSTCLLISQNRQAAKDRIRSDIEYEINLKAELEVAHLHEKMDRLHFEVLDRLHSLNKQGLFEKDLY